VVKDDERSEERNGTYENAHKRLAKRISGLSRTCRADVTSADRSPTASDATLAAVCASKLVLRSGRWVPRPGCA
jgi:hypothetical protein